MDTAMNPVWKNVRGLLRCAEAKAQCPIGANSGSRVGYIRVGSENWE